MKLIKPSEISAKILSLLDESDEWVVLVSPYMKISKWYKFIKKINELKKRKIITEIYIRDDPENKATYHDLDRLSLEYYKIPHLHCKLYMNERDGIVTSMNLLLSSEMSSLEIGYATETRTEYNELFGFYQRYIHNGEPDHCETIAGGSATDMKRVICSIREDLNSKAKNSWFWLAENAMHISTGRNNYSISISKGYLRINACLRIDSATNLKSGRNSSLNLKKLNDLTTMKVDVNPGSNPDVLQLAGQAQLKMKSTCITAILEDETAYILESVKRFIDATDNLVI